MKNLNLNLKKEKIYRIFYFITEIKFILQVEKVKSQIFSFPVILLKNTKISFKILIKKLMKSSVFFFKFNTKKKLEPQHQIICKICLEIEKSPKKYEIIEEI